MTDNSQKSPSKSVHVEQVKQLDSGRVAQDRENPNNVDQNSNTRG